MRVLVILGGVVLLSMCNLASASAMDAPIVSFGSKKMVGFSFGDTCDRKFGDETDIDMPNDQYQVFFIGERRPGGVFIHQVQVKVGPAPYPYSAPRGITLDGAPIGGRKDNTPNFAVAGAGAVIAPNNSETFPVDKGFERAGGEVVPGLGYGASAGADAGACDILQFRVDP